jgi:ABC-type multidrug transport system fused ATPase/permease subunit
MAKIRKYLQPSLIYLFGSIGIFIWSMWVTEWFLRITFVLFAVCFFLLYLKTFEDESDERKRG